MRIGCIFLLSLWSLGAVNGWSQSLETVEWSSEHVFTQMPYVAGVESGGARIRWDAVSPMAAIVHYGGFPADQELCLPLFRFLVKAEQIGKSGEMEARLKVDRFLRDIYNMAKGTSLEKVVVYRLEIMDAQEGIVRYYESRFRYDVVDAQDGRAWVLRPCIVDGPFVDLVTHRSAVISFDADSLCYARVLLNGRQIVSRDENGQPLRARHHEIAVADLDPATRYPYRVEIASDAGHQNHSLIWPERTFRTAPRPGRRAAFSFVYMSDGRQCPGGGELGFGGVNYLIVGQFMVDLYRRGADLVLFAGDLIDGYTSSRESFLRQLFTWKKAVEPVASYLPIYEGVGNHEQVGDYIKAQLPGQDTLTLYADRAGQESGEALFAAMFVNPPGSSYGFGPPDPEDQWPGVGPGLEDELQRWSLPQKKGPPYDETVYSFDYGNVHFISINTNYWYTGVYYGDVQEVNAALQIAGGNREGYLMKKQLAWLERDLEEAQGDEDVYWIVLFAHEPAFPNGGHVGDAMFWGRDGKAQDGGLNDPAVPSGDVLDMRDRFWGLVSSYSKTLAVFFGDEHNYSRTYIDDSVNPDFRHPVWQIVSGGAGAPFYGQDLSVPWLAQVKAFTSLPHYCLVSVDGQKVEMEVWARSGQLVEKVALSDLPR